MPMTVTGLLAEQGVDAFGVDISPEMVRVARDNHPRARFEISPEGYGGHPMKVLVNLRRPAEWESRLRRHGLHLEAHAIHEIDDPRHGTRSTPAKCSADARRFLGPYPSAISGSGMQSSRPRSSIWRASCSALTFAQRGTCVGRLHTLGGCRFWSSTVRTSWAVVPTAGGVTGPAQHAGCMTAFRPPSCPRTRSCWSSRARQGVVAVPVRRDASVRFTQRGRGTTRSLTR